ncbi:ROK family protein [Thermohalobacter berrensis]|uniref:Glucokinase n=1 Tax=Thermohalobacter berrensis TaxID=99594 RepID=A0A419SXX7_9FIRM|nr:ROK family protein [Thermohalobacter berrensis]RKD30112.1 glucokinase [Thermohalobacter berrensis]
MYIGVDIGGTAIKAGIVDESGDIVKKKETATNVHRGYEAIEKDIIDLISDLKKEVEEKGNTVKSIGIGIPGIADVNHDIVIYCTNLKWRNVPLGKNLKEHFNLPVYIENDATVAGLAEAVKGSTKGYKNSLFLTLGTGVGGSIIINDKIFNGSHGIGSEIGHMIVGENFYDCNCGNNGCLETFASATALIKYTKKLIKEGYKDTIIMDKIDGDLDKLNAKIIFDSAKEGDELANKSVDRMVKYLSIGIGSLINIMDPGIIAIGGGISKAGEFLLDKIREEVPKYVIFNEVKFADIVIAQLKNDAGIIGAAMLHNFM